MLAVGLLPDSSTTHLTHWGGFTRSPALLLHIVTGLTELLLGPRQVPLPEFLLSVRKRGLISFVFTYVLRGISKGTVREMALLNTDAI